MDSKTMKTILLAVVETLNAVELRTDQVKTAAKIHACSMKLSEVLETVKEESNSETENQHGE